MAPCFDDFKLKSQVDPIRVVIPEHTCPHLLSGEQQEMHVNRDLKRLKVRYREKEQMISVLIVLTFD